MTQQKKVVKNKAGDNNGIKLSNGWAITKDNEGNYMIHNINVFIHGDEISFWSKNKVNASLNIFQDDVYIGSLWIDNAVEIELIKEFIKVD